MKFDLATSTSFNAASHAAGTVGASHQHDIMLNYAAAFNVVNDAPATKTFASSALTITGDFINITAHGYKTGLLGALTTTSALPSDLTATGNYYVVALSVDTIQLALSRANALAGTVVDITAKDGTGTHSFKPTAIAGLDVHLERSLDGLSWEDIAGSTVAAAGFSVQSYVGVAYPYVRAESTLTAGQITATVNIRSNGWS